MESLPQHASSPVVAPRQRTSIPLRSILNAEEVCEAAATLEPKTSQSANKVLTDPNPAVQRPQFLFVNAHNASRPQTRLPHDQKVINAHVQYTSHRKRRAAAIDRLKHTHRLCAQCSQSSTHGSVTAQDHLSSPSSSASESAPTSAIVRKAPLHWPQPKGSEDTHVCAQCGIRLQSTKGSHTGYDAPKKGVRRASPSTTALVAAKEKPSPPALFVEGKPTSFLDTGIIDQFASFSVPMNVEMNGELLHCESDSYNL